MKLNRAKNILNGSKNVIKKISNDKKVKDIGNLIKTKWKSLEHRKNVGGNFPKEATIQLISNFLMIQGLEAARKKGIELKEKREKQERRDKIKNFLNNEGEK